MAVQVIPELESVSPYPQRKDPQDRFDTLIKEAVDGGAKAVSELNTKFIPNYNTSVSVMNWIDQNREEILAVDNNAAAALASKNAAKASQDAAKTSETNAAASQSSAANSAATATSKATAAGNSASAALASQNAAKTSETNAAGSASTATAKASAAATSAAEALASKNAAGTSAATATTKAADASTSATNAATSAAQAANDATRAETAANSAEAIAGGNYVVATRKVIAGTGLSGGGDLTADRTLAVKYGTAAGTACQGNDARLSNARTPTGHAARHQHGGTDEIATATPAANAIPKADANGKLNAWVDVIALGYPVVIMTPKVVTGRPTNVNLSAPAVLLPGATVAAYHVSVDGGEAQDVPATDNAAVFTFTPTGAAGSTVTLRVTATDSVGNVSLETVTTAEVVNGYVMAPTIISPIAGANLYSTPIPVVTSAFSVFGTDDTHASTDWKITSDEAGNTVVSEALASSDLLAHSFPAITVTQVEPRHLWARHNGQNIGPSDWGHVAVNINPSRHGEILYDTSNNPAAVITGSYLSGGTEPWCIRGRYVWLAFALASKRGVDKTWNLSSSDYDYVDITTIENPGTSWKLAANNTAADGSGSYVSALSTEAHMDASFTYAQTVKTSKELTSAILTYNASYMAAQFCRTVVLKDLGAMDLPSIDVLMRLYQARTIVDALDPTASANTAKKLSAWGFGSANGASVWSASGYSSSSAWRVNSDGNVLGNSRYGRFGCVPSLEIPA